jgi:hypothetical protein
MRATVLSFLLFLPSLAQAEVRPLWSFFPGFPLPGINGMALQDLDGDGMLEGVITGSPTGTFGAGSDVHLSVLDHGPEGFKIVSLVPLASTNFAGRVLTVPARPGAAPSVLISQVALDGTTSLVQYSGIPLRETSRVPVEMNFQAYQIVDVDGDGELEVLGLRGGAPFVTEGFPEIVDLATGVTEWTEPVFAMGIGAGQLDADPALEIVIGQFNAAGRVLDGATRAVDWTYPDGFSGWPVFGNFRGDDGSVQEFAVVANWGTQIFVAEPIYSPIDEIPTGDGGVQVVLDINGDGYDELIIGGRQGGTIAGYSTVLGTQLFEYYGGASGVNAVVVGEMDGNSGLEILHSAGLASTGEDIVRVLDLPSGAIHYLSVDERGPHSSVMLADLDGDMAEELVWATTASRSFYGGSTLVVLDASTGNELRRRADVLAPAGTNPGVSMATIDIENDGLREIVVGSGRLYDPQVAVLDSATLDDRWRVEISNAGGFVTALATMSFNADQVDDIVAASGQRIVILNGSNGQELFRSVSFSMGLLTTVAVGDINGDSQDDIAFAVGETIYILNPFSGLIEHSHTLSDVAMGLAVEAPQGSCRLAVTFPDRVEQRGCTTGSLIETRMFGFDATFVGFPTDSDGPLVLSDGQRIYRMQDDMITSQSAEIDNQLGDYNRGVVVGGAEELNVYMGGMHGVHRIELPVEEPMFADGFED